MTTTAKKTAAKSAAVIIPELEKANLVAALKKAAAELSQATEFKAGAEAGLMEAKIALSKAEASLVLSGNITGKNEQERRAQLLTSLSDEYEAVRLGEAEVLATTFALNRAKIAWDLEREYVKISQLSNFPDS